MAPVANATVVITQDPGGVIEEFVQKYETIRASGDNVEIDGICASACTLVLGIVPHDRICATARGVFGFHSAFAEYLDGHREFSYEGTRQLWRTYPWNVRQAIRRSGWDGHSPHPKVIWIAAERFVKPCTRVVDMAGRGWMFPPRPYDPNAPIEAPVVQQQDRHAGKPLPLHPKHKPAVVHHTATKPVVVAPSITVPPVELPQVTPPVLAPGPQVNVLPKYLPYILKALYALAGVITVTIVMSVGGFFYAAAGKGKK